MKSKYHAKKTLFAGMMFDSQKELRRYIELKTLESKGLVKDLKRQVKFELIPSQPDKHERACNYIADFTYRLNGQDKLIVEDVKGYKTAEYIIKRKLMKYIYTDIDFKES